MNDSPERFLSTLKNKNVALCGIGRSNLPLIRLFADYGAKVTACDKRTESELGELAEQAKSEGAMLSLGEKYLENLNADVVLRTPGMKYYLPELTEMRKHGTSVTSETELFFQLCPCKTIAVTGSDGKTTTTTIISEILKKHGKNVFLGGNIGTPLLPRIRQITTDDYAVAELSSFQLISMRESPDIAVVTNLAPNHLDIHKDMDEYIQAKRNIILHQNAFSKTVLNADNKLTMGFADDVRGELFTFSLTHPVDNGAYLDSDGNITVNRYGTKTIVMNRSDIKIEGIHNVDNYLAAICAVWDIVPVECIVDVAREFGGVEHRTEFVRTVKGVRYFNDSIASSPTRTMQGTLSLYDNRIVLIAGGYDKHIPYDELGNKIAQKVKLLILMGNTADKIEHAVRASLNFDEDALRILRVHNMEDAVKAAYSNTREGDVVSLSPASASFDLYKNFDDRGKDFKRIINELEE